MMIFKRITCLISLLAFGLGIALSQTPSLQQTAGIYYAYPGPQSVQAKAPEGYQPFYISHYGRHGSRWITDDERYTIVTSAFDSLKNLDQLTELGEDVRNRLHRVTDDAIGRSGNLSPIGEQQHKGIAERMYDNYPEVFADTSKIESVSSTSMRCAMSMAAFNERLKEKNPHLQISRNAYDKNMEYIAYTSDAGKRFTSKRAPWWKEWNYYVDTIVDPARFTASLMTNPDQLTKKQQYELMMALYWIASDMQDVEVDEDFYDIFTYDELNGIWRTINARMYACNGNAPINEGIMRHCADNLLANIIEHADAAIAAGNVSANLRFGHDTHLLRLLSLMQIEGCNLQEKDMNKYHEVWQDYKLSPMAANLQIIFFKNDKDDVIVKLMLNENDVTLPITSHMAPYYPWEDVRFLWVAELP